MVRRRVKGKHQKGRKPRLPAFLIFSSGLAFLDVCHWVGVGVDDVLGLFLGPFFLDGFN
jgi:hypothetical protein